MERVPLPFACSVLTFVPVHSLSREPAFGRALSGASLNRQRTFGPTGLKQIQAFAFTPDRVALFSLAYTDTLMPPRMPVPLYSPPSTPPLPHRRPDASNPAIPLQPRHIDILVPPHTHTHTHLHPCHIDALTLHPPPLLPTSLGTSTP
eukprot:scaffold2679_cov97-Isochrysis_galbana.AAC.4